jgi:hypothetical protein
MSDRKKVDHLGVGLCVYSFAAVVGLYFLATAWVRMNEICNPLIDFLMAGSIVTLSILRLCILGRRALKQRGKP